MTVVRSGAQGQPGGQERAPGLTGIVLEGRYRVGSRLARGGMSTVYRGLDLRLDRPVAIKVMSQEYAADPTFLTRFEREARAAARLDHPGVVAVYDQGRDGDTVFLVMELVDGGTLRDLLRARGVLSVPETLAVLEPLLGALSAAHSAGLVHRDVKPENVLISTRGEVKVADFGLVRAVASTTMATGNVILGTVAYLSPEQVATGSADARSDVYAAGVVGYEMLTGHPPFAGDNAIAVAYQHVHSDVPAVEIEAPGVPVGVAAAIDAATRRDPLARPRDAADFLARLRATRAELGLRLSPAPAPRAPRPGAGRIHPSTTQARLESPAARTAEHPGEPTAIAARSGGPPAPTDRMTRRPRRGRARWRLRIIILLVVLLVGAAAAFGGWWLGGRWTSTPDVQGIAENAAVALVRDAGLIPELSTAPDDVVPSGKVATARPTAGTRLLRGSTVTMVVSSGRPRVPEIASGTAVDTASAAIRAVGLTVATDPAADVYDRAAPPGSVVRTDPAGGDPVDIGGTVRLIRSLGPPPVPVPPVAGKADDDARNALLVAGFTVGNPVSRFDPDQPAGTVIGTEPQAGAAAPYGSPVSLVIATSLTVPTVSGTPRDAAFATLTAQGFVPTLGAPAFDAGVPGGDVIGTEPAAGSRIDPAQPQVSVIVSTAVQVPDLTQGNVGQARSTLAGLGLGMDVRALFGSDGSTVTGQSPDPGTLVQPGSTVTVDAWP
jgi:serine/threonine-protein kinase